MDRKCFILAVLAVCCWASVVHGQIIFSQDFDAGNAAGFNPDNPNWAVTPYGTYTIENKGDEVFAWSYAGGADWADYIFSYDLKSHDSVNQLAAFRVQSPGNCYVLNMRSAPFNDIILTKWTAGWQSHLQVVDYANANGIWHHFDIQLSGPEISVHVDEQFVFTYSDPTAQPYLSGGIAAVSYSGGVVQHQVLSIDNVIVDIGTVAVESSTWSGVKALYR